MTRRKHSHFEKWAGKTPPQPPMKHRGDADWDQLDEAIYRSTLKRSGIWGWLYVLFTRNRVQAGHPLPPGANLVHNRTGRDEYIFSADQWDQIQREADQ